ncbi:MAG: DUF4097 family beta strand repeat-containing protein [Candidatus Dormibacteraceae bacterium]
MIATVSVVACGSSNSGGGAPNQGPISRSGDEQEQTTSYTVSDPVTSLVVDDHAGNVRVIGGDGNGVAVIERAVFQNTAPQATHKVESGQLTLTYSCPNGSCGINYEVHIPRSLSVQVNSDAGNVWLHSLSGEVKTNVQAGNVEAAFDQPPNMVNFTVGAGNLSLRLPGEDTYAVNATVEVGMSNVDVQQDASSSHKINARVNVGRLTIDTRDTR